MTEVEMYSRMTFYNGFSAFEIFEHRWLGYAVFILEAFHEEQVHRQRQPPAALVRELQRLLTTLLRHLRQSSINIKQFRMIVEINHDAKI